MARITHRMRFAPEIQALLMAAGDDEAARRLALKEAGRAVRRQTRGAWPYRVFRDEARVQLGLKQRGPRHARGLQLVLDLDDHA